MCHTTQLSNSKPGPIRPTVDSRERVDVALDTVVPTDPNAAYDMHRVIETVLDERHFMPLMAAYAKNIITGFGRVEGQTVGIIANQPSGTYAARLELELRSLPSH
eukprot:SAG11_NODE_3092_length_2700_cov_1.904652_3_plen_105_part_00